ncbi:UbiA family prenyltransferase [Bradyrhizobium guangzhouense]|uniref:UbiA family prenyltransferase n=1 Tax=Bradyrhizobium guangzhouense TaxID=1325095 RepID=UPI0010099371|nr:UbiA family prenyltransferase [Bradyrhizobium guangzhouense]RXH10127.1 hypothetical protein EAS54_32275 [Bradyrhizobium guangzhouense]
MTTMEREMIGVPVQAGIRQYLAILRLDHSTKHVFILPGIVLAYLLRGIRTDHLLASLVLGLAAAVCVASANYAINEWLDRDYDKHHPTKSQRAAIKTTMNGKVVGLAWLFLIMTGLSLALLSSRLAFAAACLFAVQGILYNVPPLRSKDRAYLDVITESINNPIRLIIGWSIIDPTSLPPGSIILCYWCGGAFLMAAKRLSEYREIVASHGTEVLSRYRASFATYDEVTLTASCIGYSLFAVAFLSIFLDKYRIEYILTMPVVVLLFTVYFMKATSPGSSAQKPEKLFSDYSIMAIVLLLVAVFAFTSLVDLPILGNIAGQHYITLE